MEIALSIVSFLLLISSFWAERAFSDVNEVRIDVSGEEEKSSLSTYFYKKAEILHAEITLTAILSTVIFVVSFTYIPFVLEVPRFVLPLFSLVICVLSVCVSLWIYDILPSFVSVFIGTGFSWFIYVFTYPLAFVFRKMFSMESMSLSRMYDIRLKDIPVAMGGKKEENEVEIFKNALDFSQLKLKNCIVPRTELTAIDITDGVDEIRRLFIQTNYSRILVYKGDIDNVVGYVHSADMFSHPAEISEIINPIIVVSEEMEAKQLLDILLKQKKSLALVVDEFGGTAGIITMEDIMEEIFGEIEDESDEEDKLIINLSGEGEYIISGRAEVESAIEKTGCPLPLSDEYETIAGLILSRCNLIPHKGDIIKIDTNLEFEILKTGITKIELVKMRHRGVSV